MLKLILGQGKNPKLRVSSYFHIYIQMMGYFRLGKSAPKDYSLLQGLEIEEKHCEITDSSFDPNI